jgi:hypothetical protein
LQCPSRFDQGFVFVINFGPLLIFHNAQPLVAQNGGSQNTPLWGLLHLNKVPQAFFQVRKNALFRVEMN